MSNTELAPAFFLAVVVILLTCRLVGWALRALGQPPVVGEMVAGVVLGPSVLGLIAPAAEAALFPQQLRPVLYVVGQIGLVVFMFQAGYEFRVDRLRAVARSATAISLAGVLAPLLLGIGLTVLADGLVDVFPDNVSLTVSALFVGVALSITAFPMLARIITERGLTGSRFGSIAMASGALDDAVAWVLLAGVLSIAGGSAGPFAVAIGGTLGLVLILTLLARGSNRVAALAGRVTAENLVLVLVIALFLAAWYTDVIGLYAVFGAFSLGVVFPRSEAVDQAVHTLRPVGAVLLPLFFTYSGLNTDFGLLFHADLLLFTLACVLAAVAGKFGACWLAARLTGEEPAVAVRVGTLMNARGLMQLIAINVGLAAGIVTKELFSALVVVALVTTMMATPMLSFWDRRDRKRQRADELTQVS
ncbi:MULTISPECIES: cation:proton antiporter [unclassified Crossiella]|uniref:cation:proton antiporter n=1 Tax=unclassified Crossiella TaxID=2620835 RepID=UPI001FFEFE78|nr:MULTISPECIES: cation:proton antiporter [unclassified Crossiella]MCK2241432.1 cation:proton antiporter [Crossiella sp. S99.2]MCK2255696.1 cation:proton antiporter [Crossiella sp. S99.1]